MLRAEGSSYDKISEIMKVSKNTLMKLRHELQNEISNAYYFKIQNILEQYEITQKKRVEFLASQLDKIHKAIDKKDYDELSLVELNELRMKISNQIMLMVQGLNYDTGESETKPYFDTIQETFQQEIKYPLEN